MSCNGCIKFLVISFNVLLLIFGLALIGMGAVAKVAVGDYWSSLSNWQSGAPVYIICVGIILAFISILGIVAVCSESKCLMVTFAVLLITLFVLQLSVAIVAFTARSKIENTGKSLMEKAFKKAYTNKKGEHLNTAFFDKIQKELKCCGVNGMSDYVTVNKTVPQTCCHKTKPCIKGNMYTEGCVKSMKTIVGKNFLSIAVAEIIFCLTNLLQIVLVFSLLVRLPRYNPV